MNPLRAGNFNRKSATMVYNPHFCLAIYRFMGSQPIGWPPIDTGLQPMPLESQSKLLGREARQTGK